MLIPVPSIEAPELAPYRDLTRPDALLARGLFVAEGRLVVARLVSLDTWRLHSLLLTPTAAAALDATLARVPAAVPVYVVPADAVHAVVGVSIHRGCLALAERPALRPVSRDALAAARRVLVLEGVNNPDNVGGLFRAGAALGVDLALLGPACGDPLYRKAIRTSMGACLSLPWHPATDAWPHALDRLRDCGLSVVACTPSPAAPSLYDVELPARAAVLVGAEGPGLSDEALARADLAVRVPMHGGMDSLNVTSAAAIVLSALDRRRGAAAQG